MTRGRAMHVGLPVLIVVLALAASSAAAGEARGKRPSLDMRVTPKMAFSPVSALVTAELKGGDDVEEYYCPELEWDWDDGSKSTQEADCPPFESGSTIQRRFSERHEYPRSGNYNIKITLRRLGKAIATQTVLLNVRPGFGDPTIER